MYWFFTHFILGWESRNCWGFQNTQKRWTANSFPAISFGTLRSEVSSSQTQTTSRTASDLQQKLNIQICLSVSSLLFFGTHSHHAHGKTTIWFLCMFVFDCLPSFYAFNPITFTPLAELMVSVRYQSFHIRWMTDSWRYSNSVTKISLVHVNSW